MRRGVWRFGEGKGAGEGDRGGGQGRGPGKEDREGGQGRGTGEGAKEASFEDDFRTPRYQSLQVVRPRE